MLGSKSKSVGVIGLGIIGSRVAECLRKAGHDVFVWNRSSKPFPNFMASPSEIAEVATIIQIFVRDAEALLEVLESMKGGLQKHHVVLCHSTVSVRAMKKAAAIVASTGAGFLDAPFTGSLKAAEAGDLVYYIGGEKAQLEKARRTLEVTSKSILHLGGTGDATVLKIATNLISAAVVEALAEAVAITKAEGIDITKLQEALAGNANGSPLVQMKLPTMASRSYQAHFSLKNMLKDARYAQAIADERGFSLPVLNASAQVMDRGVQAGKGELDYAVVMENFAQVFRVSDVVLEKQAPAGSKEDDFLDTPLTETPPPVKKEEPVTVPEAAKAGEISAPPPPSVEKAAAAAAVSESKETDSSAPVPVEKAPAEAPEKVAPVAAGPASPPVETVAAKETAPSEPPPAPERPRPPAEVTGKEADTPQKANGAAKDLVVAPPATAATPPPPPAKLPEKPKNRLKNLFGGFLGRKEVKEDPPKPVLLAQKTRRPPPAPPVAPTATPPPPPVKPSLTQMLPSLKGGEAGPPSAPKAPAMPEAALPEEPRIEKTLGLPKPPAPKPLKEIRIAPAPLTRPSLLRGGSKATLVGIITAGQTGPSGRAPTRMLASDATGTKPPAGAPATPPPPAQDVETFVVLDEAPAPRNITPAPAEFISGTAAAEETVPAGEALPPQENSPPEPAVHPPDPVGGKIEDAPYHETADIVSSIPQEQTSVTEPRTELPQPLAAETVPAPGAGLESSANEAATLEIKESGKAAPESEPEVHDQAVAEEAPAFAAEKEASSEQPVPVEEASPLESVAAFQAEAPAREAPPPAEREAEPEPAPAPTPPPAVSKPESVTFVVPEEPLRPVNPPPREVSIPAVITGASMVRATLSAMGRETEPASAAEPSKDPTSQKPAGSGRELTAARKILKEIMELERSTKRFMSPALPAPEPDAPPPSSAPAPAPTPPRVSAVPPAPRFTPPPKPAPAPWTESAAPVIAPIAPPPPEPPVPATPQSPLETVRNPVIRVPGAKPVMRFRLKAAPLEEENSFQGDNS